MSHRIDRLDKDQIALYDRSTVLVKELAGQPAEALSEHPGVQALVEQVKATA